MEDIEVKRFAVKYDPPTLVIEYKNSSGSLFLKKIRLKLKTKMDAELLCDKVIEKNPMLLGPEHVCRTQLLDLIKLLLQESGLSLPDREEIPQSFVNDDVEKENNISGFDNQTQEDNQEDKRTDDQKEFKNVEKDPSKIDTEDLNNVDLNKYDDAALSNVKLKMDVNFDQNRITPDHPDYVWNKEVEFDDADEDCDWDEESD